MKTVLIKNLIPLQNFIHPNSETFCFAGRSKGKFHFFNLSTGEVITDRLGEIKVYIAA